MFARRAIHLSALLAILTAARTSFSAEPAAKSAFAVEEKSDRLIITDGGKLVAEYVFHDPVIKRPYFSKVHTPSGIQVTRNHPPLEGKDLADHPTFHPGIWWGFGDINGEDFWRNKATIRHEQFDNSSRPEGPIHILHKCSLVDSSGREIGEASFFTRWIRLVLPPSTQPSYLISCIVLLTSGESGLLMGDQEEMGLGVRLATPIAEKNGGLVSGEGNKKGAKVIWGTRSKWCDYSGRIDGRAVGVTLLARQLEKHPSWWHVRDYGLLVANGFGKRALADHPDPKIRSRIERPLRLIAVGYRLIIHDAPDYDPAAVVGALIGDDAARETPP